MTKDKALRLALEALEFDGFTPEDATHRIFTIKAIAAINEALAQPEQEENTKQRVLQLIKELRPAIRPMEALGKPMTTQEWFDVLVKNIEVMI